MTNLFKVKLISKLLGGFDIVLNGVDEMKKLILSGLFGLALFSIIKANSANYIQDCLAKCERAKQICGTQATLTRVRVNACEAIDDNFGKSYNCSTVCTRNPRTIRFDAVK